MSGEGFSDAASVRSATSPSPTRAFLFADLRGYTLVVETHGAVRAAELLERYRALVRDAVGRFDGSEIKTEGDSFYVVFDSVSAAVQCGLAIQTAAADASAEATDPPIRVGVGVHAGETVAVADGYVGSAVNIAARLCAQATAGEVLVSDTVRSLTQTVLPVVFVSRGRRQLKGVPEPMAVFAAVPTAGEDAWAVGARATAKRRGRRRRVAIGALAGTAVIATVAMAVYALRPPPGLPPGPWTIAVDLPLTGPIGTGLGLAIADAVKLAVQEANAAGDLGVELQVDVSDHGTAADPYIDLDRALSNVNGTVADPRVIALVGPADSSTATKQIPVTSKAGLLQCSPSATKPGLTKPRDGALDLRAAAPERINFIRTAPADDIQGKAAASYLFNDLRVRHLLVVEDDDPQIDGAIPAASVNEAFEKLGGRVTRRSLNPGAAPSTVLEPLASSGDRPTAVFFSGAGPDHASEIRRAMVDSGHSDVPFIVWDWIGIDPETITAMGVGGKGTYATHASFAPPRSDFVDRYRAAYGREPGEFDSAAYACTQVILAALRDVAREGVNAGTLREALRASVVDPAKRYETVLGRIGFDSNGDSLQQFAQILRAQPGSNGQQPAWVLQSAQDYGPAP